MKTDHTPADERAIEFDVILDPAGTMAAEHSPEDEPYVKALLGRLGQPGHRAPRLLPHADEILTPEEAAMHLGIPKKTVIFLCAEGRLEGAFKAGRRWRVPGRAVRKMAGVP